MAFKKVLPPAELPPALARTSWSSLKQYLWCPEQWRRKRLLGGTELPGWASVAGKAVHELTEVYDAHVAEHGEPDEAADDGWNWDAQWAVIFARTIAEEYAATKVHPDEWRVSGKASKAWPDKETKAFWDHEGPLMGARWADWRRENPGYQVWVTPDGKSGVELSLLVDFGGTPLLGFVDRVYQVGNRLMVVDIKSGRNMPEDTLQLIMYASLIELKYGIRPELGAYWDARKGTLGYPEDMSVIGTDDMIQLCQEFLSLATAGTFMAKVDRHCTYCPFRHDCQWAKTLTFGIRKGAGL